MYSLELGKQILEIPAQMLHQWRSAKIDQWPERYRFGQGWRQYLLWWAPPAGLPERKSVVVFYHGGGWRLGRPEMFPAIAGYFTQKGFHVIMPAYRLTPWFNHRHMRQDLNLALARSLQLMEMKGLRDKKMLITGMSAGATLAAHLAFNEEELNGLGISQSLFSGFLSVGGPLDLHQIPDFRAVRNYTGGKRGSAAFEDANPVRWLTGKEQMPALLLHGTIDAIVPYACSEAFARQYAGPLEFITLPGKSHLASARFATDDLETAGAVNQWLEGF